MPRVTFSIFFLTCLRISGLKLKVICRLSAESNRKYTEHMHGSTCLCWKEAPGQIFQLLNIFKQIELQFRTQFLCALLYRFKRGNAVPRIYPSVKTLFFSSRVEFINFSHILGIRMKLWRRKGQCVYGSNRHLLLGAVLHIVCERAESEFRLHIIRFGWSCYKSQLNRISTRLQKVYNTCIIFGRLDFLKI
jgi:hypothetical protein